jgi:alkylated DNA repair protein (DNA oxidative demethylase)
MPGLFDESRRTTEIAPGAIHLPGWLDLSRQRRIVDAFTEWCRGPVPLRAAVLPGGRRMTVETVCLGWHWQPYRYTRVAGDVNGARVLDLPAWLAELGRQALTDAGWPSSDVASYQPDTALVNYYSDGARLGMHQDKDEQINQPVVSFSIGDTGRFRFGNTHGRGRPYTDVDLVGGDAFVFGGPSRFAYHGVPATLPGTADPASGLSRGRINITMRVTGLT